jgi:hypothetical protein
MASNIGWFLCGWIWCYAFISLSSYLARRAYYKELRDKEAPHGD